jgi:hypothetical protein
MAGRFQDRFRSLRKDPLVPRKQTNTGKDNPFNPNHQYFVYLAPEWGGGKRLLIVDKLCRFGGHGETYEIYAYEVSKGLIVDRVIKQAELMDFAFLGSISGFGANAYHTYGGDIREFIRTYGTRPRRMSLWKRIRRAFGFPIR